MKSILLFACSILTCSAFANLLILSPAQTQKILAEISATQDSQAALVIKKITESKGAAFDGRLQVRGLNCTQNSGAKICVVRLILDQSTAGEFSFRAGSDVTFAEVSPSVWRQTGLKELDPTQYNLPELE